MRPQASWEWGKEPWNLLVTWAGGAAGDEEEKGGDQRVWGLLLREEQQPVPARAEGLTLVCCVFVSQNLVGDQEHLTIQVSELEEEVSNLRKINKDLFDFSTRIITKPAK